MRKRKLERVALACVVFLTPDTILCSRDVLVRRFGAEKLYFCCSVLQIDHVTSLLNEQSVRRLIIIRVRSIVGRHDGRRRTRGDDDGFQQSRLRREDEQLFAEPEARRRESDLRFRAIRRKAVGKEEENARWHVFERRHETVENSHCNHGSRFVGMHRSSRLRYRYMDHVTSCILNAMLVSL